MARNNENSRNTSKPPGFRDVPRVGGGKFGHDVVPNNRRALRDIRNLVTAPRPCAAGKRGIPDKNIVDDKKNTVAFAAHRPITRRFAASLKSQSATQDLNPGNENHTKQVLAPSNANSMDTSCAIDVDDYKSINDLPLPMAEEVEEAMYEEFREVEMEDLVTESMLDIDSCDCDNPLAVVEYVEDLYSFYRQMEASGCVSPDYMSNQFDINEKMRAILIDWLIEVHYKFELLDETLFLTVNIIDRFLAQQTVVRKKLQLVGVTAMLLACKYEEVSVPVVEDLILISDRAYTRKEVLDMEKLIVNTLNFNMSVPTPYVFMRRFLKAANSDKKLDLLSFFIMELCLVEHAMLKFQPSLLAAAAIFTAQSALMGLSHWNKTSELHASYTEEQLLECSRMMVDFHQKAGTGKITGVHRKYSTFRFGFVAKCEPANFLLDTRP